MNTSEARNDLDFDVAKSMRYHSYRRAFWDSVDNASKILTIISGTAVLVTLVGKAPVWPEVLAVVVAVASACDVVLGFSIQARAHDGLYRSFSRLAQELSEHESPTEQQIFAWRKQRIEIEMDEPTVMDLRERRCAGEEARARGLEVNQAWQLSSWQIILSQFAFWPAAYKEDVPYA